MPIDLQPSVSTTKKRTYTSPTLQPISSAQQFFAQATSTGPISPGRKLLKLDAFDITIFPSDPKF